MKLAPCGLLVLLGLLCQALPISAAPQVEPHHAPFNGNHTEEFSNPVLRRLDACSWTLTPPPNSSSEEAALPSDSSSELLAEQICQALGCGSVYRLNRSRPAAAAAAAASCFTGCSLLQGQLVNCSQAAATEMNCSVITEAVCGQQVLRLSGRADRCAGRVELWRAWGGWGTVCDDQWDLSEGQVVCRQLGCGHAQRVTGQGDGGGGGGGGGSGPVYLDELNCTGGESNLWECPHAQGDSDCGHKEDAGVVCSGSLAPPTERPLSSSSAVTPDTEDVTGIACRSAGWTPLLALAFLIVLLLLVLLLTTACCWRYRRRLVDLTHTHTALALQQARSVPAPPAASPRKTADSGNLLKVTSGQDYSEAPTAAPARALTPTWTPTRTPAQTPWNRFSSIDSPSVDTDYEQEPQWHRADVRPLMRPSGHACRQEDPVAIYRAAVAGPGAGPGAASSDWNGGPADYYARVSKVIVDTSDLSSTSSEEEAYQNIPDYVTPAKAAPSMDQSCSVPCNDPIAFQETTHSETSDEDEGPIYSPVSPDDEVSSDDDYDDVGALTLC